MRNQGNIDIVKVILNLFDELTSDTITIANRFFLFCGIICAIVFIISLIFAGVKVKRHEGIPIALVLGSLFATIVCFSATALLGF